MRKCYDHEECEYNAQPDCALSDGAQCPHGVPRTNTDGIRLATMAQESLDDAMIYFARQGRKRNAGISTAASRGGNVMDIEKLIERLKSWDGIKPD